MASAQQPDAISPQATSRSPHDSTKAEGKQQLVPLSLSDDSADGEVPREGAPTDAAATSEENEKTVISSHTPIPASTIPAGLRPLELGSILIGERLGDLWLEEFIGGGGMGAVFRAVDKKLQRNVAVKVLSTHLAGDQDTARRFELEAQSAARLDHPHIARVHYVGEDRGVPYIVFEYIEGTNLRDMVHASGPLPVAEAIDYTLQIADALCHAWQRDVTHRDIKPSNILITPDGQAKLVDMGLARLNHLDHTDHDLTVSGMTLGTFDYISPEQARNPKVADTRSDIYSLGCSLYFMLTGQPPFSGGTALQKLLQHHSDVPPSLQQFRSDVPESVGQLLDMMMAKRIEDRFQHPVELLTALVTVAEPLGIGHAPVPLPGHWQTSRTSSSWLRRNVVWVVPVVLLFAGVFLMEQLLGGDEAPPLFLDEPAPAALDSDSIPPPLPLPPEVSAPANLGVEAGVNDVPDTPTAAVAVDAQQPPENSSDRVEPFADHDAPGSQPRSPDRQESRESTRASNEDSASLPSVPPKSEAVSP